MTVELSIILSLIFSNATKGNEYVFIGNFGAMYTMIPGEECINKIPSIFTGGSSIRESMYSVENGEFSVYILASSRRIYRYSSQLKNKGKYEVLTKRKEYRAGLFYDYIEKSIATASTVHKVTNGRRMLEKDKFYLLNDNEKKEKTKLDTCLFVWSNSPRRYFPSGEYKKEEFALKNQKSAVKIRKGGTKWFFLGQSRLWTAYSYTATGNSAGYDVNATWLKNRETGWEKVHSIENCIQGTYVYPDVVLIFSEIRQTIKLWHPPKATGDFYVQLPDEEELRKIHIDPKAKHLWANAQSVFFQLGKDVLRVDYAEGQKDPVKICEIEDELFCMFEKDNILAALADDDGKKEKRTTVKKTRKTKTTNSPAGPQTRGSTRTPT